MKTKRQLAEIAVFCVGVLLVVGGPVLAAGASTDFEANLNVVAPEALPSPLADSYEIQVGDILEISFFKFPEFNQTRTIGPDGQINLPIVKMVKAVGRTVDDLTGELCEKYSREILDPQITVSVQQFSSLEVFVGGEVNSPGAVPYRGGLSAVQAIFNAGGFMPSARLREVILIRKGADDRPVGTVVNVKNVVKNAQFGEDVAVAPWDIIYVPRTKLASAAAVMDQIYKIVPIRFQLVYRTDVNGFFDDNHH